MKARAIAAVGVILLIIGVTIGVSFAPQPLELPRLDVTMPAANPPSEMSIAALDSGTIESDAAFAYRGGKLGDKRRFSQAGVLVRHPRGDFLIDTGFGRRIQEHVATLPWLMRVFSKIEIGVPIAEQLERGGYDRKALAGIILTHAHWDHVSGVPDFAPVPVWLPAEERVWVREGGDLATVMRSFGEVPAREYRFDGGPYLGFERSFDVHGDGSIVITPAPGHTPGSVIVFVAPPSGARYAFVGDLVWQSEGISERAEKPGPSRAMVDDDPAGVRRWIAHMAALSARFPELHIVPAHDARAMAALPAFSPRAAEDAKRE